MEILFGKSLGQATRCGSKGEEDGQAGASGMVQQRGWRHTCPRVVRQYEVVTDTLRLERDEVTSVAKCGDPMLREGFQSIAWKRLRGRRPTQHSVHTI
ncbi:hypothetical protein KILIM_053_00030 [Kineosphaera limosa NBRC 100340]|uniref:Uncharacterized protein n=1 Tax=Kineosphaera limosa NBRC 100340 TaxID=1184609 RepID=K6WXX7_9MICO|nr:hypothetical protein KILIM_053_00030 [Kineosphaera limosa NBRC 100340]